MPATINHILTRTEEHQLLQRLAAGEIHAFWQIFQQHRDYLLRCCLKWMNGNSTEAEDLLSQAMVKAWEKTQKFAGKIENFKSWLTTLTRNFWIDLTRRRGANQVEDIEIYGDRDELGLVSVDDTPASALDCDEKKRVIRDAIDNLQPRLRETFILHFYGELSHQDIAQQQEISYQNVCKRISQARAILALELRGYFVGEDRTDTELSVTPTLAATESATEEMSQPNAAVEAGAGEPVTLSVAVKKVETFGDEKLPQVAVSVEDSDSDFVAATSGGRLEEFNFIRKQILGAVSPWLHRFGGSQLFHCLRKLVLEVRGEWCRWCGGDNGSRWGKLRENVRSSLSPPWYRIFYF
ncbi:sigma-70 family RNA polymerase sigma factor [Microcoleus sp. herbarium12]